VPRLLHVSDLHFGTPSVPEQVQALEAIISKESFDAIVVSGDLSQRSRTHEFTRARAFLAFARQHAPLLVVPGNHDVAWWTAPVGIGSRPAMYARYRRFISEELEPTLHLPGLTIVGLNSSHGIQPFTLTTRPRDLSVVGAIRPMQWSRARQTFAAAPAGDLKVLVFHHNLLRGRLSNRWGLASRALGIEQAARTGADVVLCGHDHEDRIEEVSAAGRRFVVSTANTLSDRVRGGRESSLNVIETTEREVRVAPWAWVGAVRTFVPQDARCFQR
jgi:3',5'-cyclic AMP phosphodiesterase CpdA